MSELEVIKTFLLSGLIGIGILAGSKLMVDTSQVVANRWIVMLKPSPHHFGENIDLAKHFAKLQTYRDYSDEDYVAALMLADNICLHASMLQQGKENVDEQDYVIISTHFAQCIDHITNLENRVQQTEQAMYNERRRMDLVYKAEMKAWQQRKEEFERQHDQNFTQDNLESMLMGNNDHSSIGSVVFKEPMPQQPPTVELKTDMVYLCKYEIQSILANFVHYVKRLVDQMQFDKVENRNTNL